MNSLLLRPPHVRIAGKRSGVFHFLSRSMFVKTENTPNPQSLKFLTGEEILPAHLGTGMHFEVTDRKALSRSPLVKKIMDTDGVKSVFLGRDFLTVTKKNEETWRILKTIIFSTILDHVASGEPTVLDHEVVSDTEILDTDSEIVAMIKELLEEKIRPSVQDDGGDILFEGFDENTGIVSVKLAGSCVGCPSSAVTLRNGVENMLKHYIPEVTGIFEVTDEEGEQEQKLEFKPNTYA